MNPKQHNTYPAVLTISDATCLIFYLNWLQIFWNSFMNVTEKSQAEGRWVSSQFSTINKSCINTIWMFPLSSKGINRAWLFSSYLKRGKNAQNKSHKKGRGNRIFLPIYKIIATPFHKYKLLLSCAGLHLICPFFPKRMPENTKNTKQKTPTKPMCPCALLSSSLEERNLYAPPLGLIGRRERLMELWCKACTGLVRLQRNFYIHPWGTESFSVSKTTIK